MADFATYIGVIPQSVPLDSSAVARGLRVTRGTNGLFTVQDATARGDMVTLRDGVASEVVDGAPMGTPAKVPALAGEATTVGATAYSFAGGKFGVTSSGAVIVGRWTVAASGNGVLGEVQLLSAL